MFHIVIEPIKRQMSELLPSEDDNDYTEVFRESLDTECVEFSVGNPRVEHITGIVHLYKRNSTPYGSAAVAQAASTTPQSSAQAAAAADSFDGSTTVCCLAIPADMSVAHFCSFIGAYLSEVRAIQVLRREGVQPSVCMVLLSFAGQQQADSFHADFHGQPFSSLEPDILCRLVFVRSVEAPQGTTELPTCPVCLERLDEHISGIVTTVCNHRFHGECLKRWGDTSCPVCRYCMYSASTSTSRCSTCGTNANLWICLICGHVGCGRYKQGHASDHWKQSAHCYALELETQRVWDYAGDGYVHRLIQSKTDGKLVEVPSPAPACSHSSPGHHSHHQQQHSRHRNSSAARALDRAGSGCSGAAAGSGSGGGAEQGGGCGSSSCPVCVDEQAQMKEALVSSKLDAITLEYNYLLTTQLDSQRQYFEGLLSQQEAAARQQLASVQQKAEAEAAQRAAALATSKEAERRRQQMKRKLSELSSAAAKAAEEREFLRSLNETLLANQKEFGAKLTAAQAAAADKDAQLQDLQEQVRDLMVFIEAQKTIQSAGGELQDATLLPMPAKEASSSSGRRRSSRK
ncbi:hypothetical protein OEZ85_010359 [Tetradesmus obliquus]|uniref:BRCA1-associated protein n=1 Tax=Tetradesmus obliquus TaxID=3088 RepID=A0ABY8TMC8_TETOB|nr:hypothetical protein OEZ85_010359 [Tetradesmus obliquus]